MNRFEAFFIVMCMALIVGLNAMYLDKRLTEIWREVHEVSYQQSAAVSRCLNHQSEPKVR